jgi:hypothetical protein
MLPFSAPASNASFTSVVSQPPGLLSSNIQRFSRRRPQVFSEQRCLLTHHRIVARSVLDRDSPMRRQTRGDHEWHPVLFNLVLPATSIALTQIRLPAATQRKEPDTDRATSSVPWNRTEWLLQDAKCRSQPGKSS